MKYFFILAAILSALSCSKKTASKDCELTVTNGTAPDNGNLSYSVTISGTGTVSSITYQDPSGPITVTNPQIPFSVNLAVTKGAAISLSATGRVNEGSTIQAGYLYLNLIGANPVNSATSCSF